MLVPQTATAQNKAPAIVVSHGWYNNREMQDLPLSALISHVIYKKTKNPYIGGIIMGIVACILTVTNTLTG